MPSNYEYEIEASRLSKDYWFTNYYMIPVVGRGPQLLVPRDYQKEVTASLGPDTLLIGLKARQIGWTTIGVANALHDALFFEEHPWLFVSRTEDAAQKMVDKAKYAYFRLPKWMKEELPRLVNQTQSSLIFDNGSRIESVPATGSTGRGDSVYGALLDECAFMEYAEEIWGAVEPLVYGPAMLFSTANGMGNFFHEIWLDSQRPDSVWTGLFFPWDVVDSRDEDWYDHTKASYRGREWLFFQEYPSSPEEAFAKSGRVAFPMDHVMEAYEPIEPHKKFKWTIGEGAKEIELHEEADIVINMWVPPTVERDPESDRPIYRPNYVVSADIAEGLEHGDFTYVNVWDANTGEQCLSCKSSIPVSYLDDLLAWCGYTYMKALMIPERNNAGVLPIDRLYRDHYYPRMYRMDRFAERRGGDRTPRFGWRTDPKTKPKMVHDFAYALAEGDVTLHDYDFVLEAQTFVADGRGGFSATEGNHDDVIMGALVGWQGVLDSPSYPILWVDEKDVAVTHDEIDAIWFNNDSQNTKADFLDRPLGQYREPVKVVKTITFTEKNIKKRENDT